jgi:hypothetical protein
MGLMNAMASAAPFRIWHEARWMPLVEFLASSSLGAGQGPQRPSEADIERLKKKIAKLERSHVLLLEHIEILSDELRVARLRLRQCNAA